MMAASARELQFGQSRHKVECDSLSEQTMEDRSVTCLRQRTARAREQARCINLEAGLAPGVMPTLAR